METKLRNTKETADYLGITDKSLVQKRYMGTGPKFIKMGRTVRYRQADIDAWLDEQTHEQTGRAS
ncbi:putative DNA-binding transcriptional regulator AlpA [Arthrobacter sp. 2762]